MTRIRTTLLALLALLIVGCPQPPGGQQGQTGGEGERKSPFATENVSVAPQVEGRAAAPTPIAPPPPAAEPTAAP